jgi:drug/metabolite transporter (DMT)-like permease
MNGLWNSALGLLLVTGLFLGINPPLGKIAAERGLPPLLWAFVISVGAGIALFAVLAARGAIRPPPWRTLRYFVIAAAISYAIPNTLILSVVPHLGAGYTGIMFTLSPVITLVLSMALGVRRPNALGVLGIVVGFAGAVMVASTRGEAGQPAEAAFVALGLLIPVSLAAGNIYRTVDWPPDSGPIELAAGSNLAAAALLLCGLLVTGEAASFAMLPNEPLLVAIQVLGSTAMFAVFFRLQAVGGPVYLSQIGYVGAAVGLVIGVILLGERYSLLTWTGAGVLSLGVALTTLAQR